MGERESCPFCYATAVCYYVRVLHQCVVALVLTQTTPTILTVRLIILGSGMTLQDYTAWIEDKVNRTSQRYQHTNIIREKTSRCCLETIFVYLETSFVSSA